MQPKLLKCWEKCIIITPKGMISMKKKTNQTNFEKLLALASKHYVKQERKNSKNSLKKSTKPTFFRKLKKRVDEYRILL